MISRNRQNQNKSQVGAGTESALFCLLNSIMEDKNAKSVGNWSDNMYYFIKDRRNGIPTNIKDQAIARGNLKKEFEKNRMSWKVFCKALRFLRVVEFKISITVTDKDGAYKEYSQLVNLGEPVYTLDTVMEQSNDSNIVDKFNVHIYEEDKGE